MYFLNTKFMNKILCLLAFSLSFLSVHAQSHNSQNDVQTLIHRVDSLEHELSYLKLTYELNAIKSEITIFANEVSSTSNSIQINLNNRTFYKELGDMYQKYFESCQYRKQSISENIEANGKLLFLKIATYSYTESELKILKGYYNVINNSYDALEKKWIY